LALVIRRSRSLSVSPARSRASAESSRGRSDGLTISWAAANVRGFSEGTRPKIRRASSEPHTVPVFRSMCQLPTCEMAWAFRRRLWLSTKARTIAPWRPMSGRSSNGILRLTFLTARLSGHKPMRSARTSWEMWRTARLNVALFYLTGDSAECAWLLLFSSVSLSTSVSESFLYWLLAPIKRAASVVSPFKASASILPVCSWKVA